MPEKSPIGNLGKEILKTIHDKKVKEEGPPDNPKTIEQAQEDLKRLGIVSESAPEITPAPIETKSAPKPPDNLPIAPETSEIKVFEKSKPAETEKKMRSKKEQPVELFQTLSKINELGEKIATIRKQQRIYKSPEKKANLQIEIDLLMEEFNKAKQLRDKLKEEMEKPAPATAKQQEDDYLKKDPFNYQDAQKIVETIFGKDVFQRPDKTIKDNKNKIEGPLMRSELIESQIKKPKNNGADYRYGSEEEIIKHAGKRKKSGHN